MLVVLDDILQPINSWIEDITVHSEAVRCSLSIWWNTAAKAEQVDLLVGVVVLQNSTNLVDHLKVLIALHIKIV